MIFKRVRKFTKGDYFIFYAYLSAWNNSAVTGRFFKMKFDTRIFRESLDFDYSLTRIALLYLKSY